MRLKNNNNNNIFSVDLLQSFVCEEGLYRFQPVFYGPGISFHKLLIIQAGGSISELYCPKDLSGLCGVQGNKWI